MGIKEKSKSSTRFTRTKSLAQPGFLGAVSSPWTMSPALTVQTWQTNEITAKTLLSLRESMDSLPPPPDLATLLLLGPLPLHHKLKSTTDKQKHRDREREKGLVGLVFLFIYFIGSDNKKNFVCFKGNAFLDLLGFV